MVRIWRNFCFRKITKYMDSFAVRHLLTLVVLSISTKIQRHTKWDVSYIKNCFIILNWNYTLLNSAMKLHYGDMTDSTCLVKLIHDVRPDEIYNLAAQSHVKVSFDLSEYTANVDGLGTLRLLDAIRTAKMTDSQGNLKTKFYQASTSEMYGKVAEVPQRETTPFHPRSPYGVAKTYAYWIVVNYREAYNMFAANGILFNHESPRRGETFVTRKITRGVAKISLGQQDCIELGNLDSKRDWGHARDYVEAMWLILQHDVSEDFVIATGETHSVREFVEVAFEYINVKIM